MTDLSKYNQNEAGQTGVYIRDNGVALGGQRLVTHDEIMKWFGTSNDILATTMKAEWLRLFPEDKKDE